MSSPEAARFAEFLESLSARIGSSDQGLGTVRDICESLHLAGAEPEGVTYAEVDANGVPATPTSPVSRRPACTGATRKSLPARPSCSVDAGVDVRIRPLTDGQHSFVIAGGRVPEVEEEIAGMGSWVRDQIGVK